LTTTVPVGAVPVDPSRETVTLAEEAWPALDGSGTCVAATLVATLQMVTFMLSKLGLKYDTKNILDMLRYFFPAPPVPVRWRRRLIAFGSGDPTRAICSSLIAEAFGRVGYPILPLIEAADDGMTHPASTYSRGEILHIRHHSLYTPRDFDLSPFFRIVKPTIEHGFDYKTLEWSAAEEGEAPPSPASSPEVTGRSSSATHC